MSATWPAVTDLRESGAPFLTLQSAHEFATRDARITGRRQRVAYRRVGAAWGAGHLRRWVVMPA